jgi:hypothetical protein
MIPALVNPHSSPWPVLPVGIHPATLEEIERVFVFNQRRRNLFVGLLRAMSALRKAGCRTVYVDGSFVTSKPEPGDYDICWDPDGVSHSLLDPVFLDFGNKRQSQKSAYGGEFFPFNFQVEPGKTFLNFFQNDRHTGQPKGIISVDLTCEPLV